MPSECNFCNYPATHTAFPKPSGGLPSFPVCRSCGSSLGPAYEVHPITSPECKEL